MGQPEFWNNNEKAQATVGELKSINSILKPLDEAIAVGTDLAALEELAREDGSLEPELATETDRLEKLVASLELASLLSGPHDSFDALVSINARDGGTDANDWAEMLLRMYSAWANKRGYAVELLDRQDDAVAGIKRSRRDPRTVGLRVPQGRNRHPPSGAYQPVQRRREAPKRALRQLDVAPEIADDDTEVELNDEDIREDVFRASGAGGQHVNKTSSAIRMTHFPTGIVVQCQSERSQHKNRATAIKMLRSRIARMQEEKREAEQLARYKQQPKTGFGSQIRNYFLHPDQRVKDQHWALCWQFSNRTRRQFGRLSQLLSSVEGIGIITAGHGRRCIRRSPATKNSSV